MTEQRTIEQQVKSELIRLAADLATGKLLPNIDTDHWYASTPLAERRQITDAMDVAHDHHRVLAMRVRDLADKL